MPLPSDLDAPIAALKARGYTHIETRCDGCGYRVHTPFDLVRSLFPQLPIDRMTLAQLGARMHCGRCPGRRRPDHVTPWRQENAAGHTRRA